MNHCTGKHPSSIRKIKMKHGIGEVGFSLEPNETEGQGVHYVMHR